MVDTYLLTAVHVIQTLGCRKTGVSSRALLESIVLSIDFEQFVKGFFGFCVVLIRTSLAELKLLNCEAGSVACCGLGIRGNIVSRDNNDDVCGVVFHAML